MKRLDRQIVNNFNDYLILENRKDDLRVKYKKAFGDVLGDELFEADPTQNKSYLDWLIKFVKNNRKEIGLTNIINDFRIRPTETDNEQEVKQYESELNKVEIISKMIKKYDKNKKDLSKKIEEINTLEELTELLDEKRQLSDLYVFDENEVKIWFDDLEWIVFQAYTYEVAQYANSRERTKDSEGGNWCTTYNNSHFDNYNGSKGGILYCVNKLDYEKDVAFELIPNDYDVRIWNWKDSEVDRISIDQMCDEFDEDSEIYNIFKDVIQRNIDTINYSREELEQSVREWYDGMDVSDIITNTSIITALDNTSYVEEFINNEISYYSESLIDFIDVYSNEIPQFLEKNLRSEEQKEEILNLYNIDDWDDLNIEEDTVIMEEWLTNNGYEYDVVKDIIEDRYSGYDAEDIISEFYGNPHNMSTDALLDLVGGSISEDELMKGYVDEIINTSTDSELIEILDY